MTSQKKFELSHINELESESIYVIREVVSQFQNPVLLFSGGKDSIVLTHLAKKAFFPARIPFPFVHIDTGHNFPETIKFRDELVKEHEINLIIGSVQKAIDNGTIQEEVGIEKSRNPLQIETLISTLESNKIDCAIGGARRDEEKSRAKERFFSHRNQFGQWDPKNQRPELWSLFNGKKNHGEHFRVFPLSNWTEIDVWKYIRNENINLPSLYFSHNRDCLTRNGVILAYSKFIQLKKNESVENMTVRFRTCGDMTITGAIKSNANNVAKVIKEITNAKTTERVGRADDLRNDNAMEDRKIRGYF